MKFILLMKLSENIKNDCYVLLKMIINRGEFYLSSIGFEKGEKD